MTNGHTHQIDNKI
uniref:V-type proton ATPase proteolipid subunit n=1 Tax=Rhizophora mucronata TaxID=61149 RepID=A0A2P2K0J2_RHIMU